MKTNKTRKKEVALSKSIGNLNLLVAFIKKAQQEFPQSISDKEQIKLLLNHLEEEADNLSKMLPL